MCQALIEKMKPTWIQPPNPDWGYVHDVYGKWYRSYFYFCATYRCDNPAAVVSENETKFTRLEYAGPGKYHMAYFRHTGQWFTVFEDLTLENCLEEVEQNQLFWP
ncbi:hypothetical protein FVR03_10230 [Pontibacter qinzhouensis]|uniref:Uncharacterized protein n=2 Tax=Pontibacter qinzhouensis TaxID=2603253 RepID=A0A5C8KAG1_9BACT|nr:hypothetical protein FVR03_10230 [Pontibacter qinzhouensis]